jgi:hypothetical protein
VRQFIVGTGGKSNYSQGTPIANSEVRNATSYGVLELTLRPAGYDWRFVPAAGDTFTDSGSDGCHNASSAGGYPRPRGAESMHIRLVPAQEECTVPNAVHGDPFALPSCSPVVPSSARLTVGTPDVNDAGTNFTGYLGLQVSGESPIDPLNGDQADVTVTAQLTDVRTAADSADYVGELEGRLVFRLTDSLSGASLDEAATASELPLSFAIPCLSTPDPDRGSECSLATSVDTLIPGAVTENGRGVWQLLEAEIRDGGADGLAATPDNAGYARPGLFGP